MVVLFGHFVFATVTEMQLGEKVQCRTSEDEGGKGSGGGSGYST